MPIVNWEGFVKEVHVPKDHQRNYILPTAPSSWEGLSSVPEHDICQLQQLKRRINNSYHVVDLFVSESFMPKGGLLKWAKENWPALIKYVRVVKIHG